MRIFFDILIVLCTLLFGGIAMIMLLLMAPTLYIARIIPILGIPLLLCLALQMTGRFSSKTYKRMWTVFLILCLCCCGYAGWGYYKDSIPTVDDRDFMLHEYEPFAPNTKSVVLSEPSALTFGGPFYKLDGATALYPIYAAFAQAIYPEGEYPLYANTEDGLGLVTCTGTITAYERLIRGETDLIFCAAPSQNQLDMAEKAGMQLHMTPIGREAFVFFVNSRNPVDNLTVEQIRKIYTGEIRNWKDVGGNRQRIRPFQRAENSGSQSALLRLMDGLPLMEPKREDRLGGMGDIINEVAAYRNYKNAIGYSFRFYATEMDGSSDIKLLALDGISPTRESIRDGSYPISNVFYAITAAPVGQPAPEDTDKDLHALLDWICSPQGQQIIEDTGYVALQ